MPAHVTNEKDVMEYFERVGDEVAAETLLKIQWFLRGRGVSKPVERPARKPRQVPPAKTGSQAGEPSGASS
jgi:hypothetical protein